MKINAAWNLPLEQSPPEDHYRDHSVNRAADSRAVSRCHPLVLAQS